MVLNNQVKQVLYDTKYPGTINNFTHAHNTVYFLFDFISF